MSTSLRRHLGVTPELPQDCHLVKFRLPSSKSSSLPAHADVQPVASVSSFEGTSTMAHVLGAWPSGINGPHAALSR